MPGFIQSPNRWVGRFGHKPEAIVIHITDGSYEGAHSWLLNPKSGVSAHYIVNQLGEYDQLVKFEDTAWHCGIVKNPTWKLLKKGTNPNLYTLGIEIALRATEPPTKKQIAIVVQMIQHLATMFQIPIDRDHIIGHNEIRSDKSCPGPHISVDALVWMAKYSLA